MPHEEGLTPDLRELEGVLGGLKPSPAALERDRLMFHAGLAAGRHRLHLWQATSVIIIMVLSSSLMLSMYSHSVSDRNNIIAQDPSSQSQKVYMAVEFSPDELRRIKGQARYILLRDEIISGGLDALPQDEGGNRSLESTITSRKLLETL